MNTDSSSHAMRDWFKRHRKALLISAGAVGVGYVLYRSLKAHYSRTVAEIEEQEAHAALLRQAEERVEAQLQSHFQNIQRISDATTLPSFLRHLKRQLFSQVDLSGLTEKLIQGKEAHQALTGQEKIELWQELKILSFTLATCSIWSLTLLYLFVRVQLNILGRHVYIDTARDISTSKPEDQRVAFDTGCQHQYIAFADFLPHRGLDVLIHDTKMAVESVLRSKSLKEACTLPDLWGIFNSICKNVEGSHKKWLTYLLPEENTLPVDLLAASLAMEDEPDAAGHVTLHHDKEKLEQLLGETRNVLASNEFREVLMLSLNAVLEGVMEEFDEIYQGRGITSIPLAKLLPPVSTLGSLLLEQPSENRFIQMIASTQHLQSFCATVYSAGER